MRKLILVVHTSLDGFVAGTQGELDDFDPSDESLAFVCKLTEGSDVALFGRVSYKLLDEYWPTAKDRTNATKAEVAFSKWYNSATKIVFSRTLAAGNLNNTVIICERISSEVIKIKEAGDKDILIFGSPSISQILMQSDLIDCYWIFINPIIFGKGIPLFVELKNKSKLKLMAKTAFANGELALNYIVKRQ